MSQPVNNILEWQHLTGAAIDAIDRTRAVILVTCSPLEVHGPHLPVVTDITEGDAIATQSAQKLLELYPDLIFIKMPHLYVAADVVPHPGSVRFRTSTITRVLADLGRSLCAQGFSKIWVSSFHGGPRHFVAIEAACAQVNKKHGGQMVSLFSLLITRLTAGRSDLGHILGALPGVSAPDLQGDHHGGYLETSLMLHLLGQHVAPSYRDQGPMTLDIDLTSRGRKPFNEHADHKPTLFRIIRGLLLKLKYYERQTYAGNPSVASPELGAQFLTTLSDLAVDALRELIEGTLHPSQCHSPLWPVRWILLNETFGAALDRIMKYRPRVW